MQKPIKNYHKTWPRDFPDAKSHVMEYLLRRINRQTLQAIKEGAAVLALAHSDYDAKVFRPYNHMSGHAQTFPPGIQNF